VLGITIRIATLSIQGLESLESKFHKPEIADWLPLTRRGAPSRQ
jgi:hypothetical protein